MKFVHAADLHLDSPLRGLERYEGAPVERVRGATRRALENLVDLCVAEEAAFLLLAGDIFDGDWKDYGTGLFFVKQMARLRQAEIPVYLVRGNHDAASTVTRYLVLPDNVHELAAKRPETKVLDRLGVAIHGQSFATRAVTEDLTAAYPAAVRGALNIGLLHTCADGRPGHEAYAPCRLAALCDKGYDYWALGHIHTREVLSEEPYVVFPGNLQGRHAREGGAKGATIVTVRDGKITAVEARPLDVVRWTLCDVDATAAHSPEDALEACRAALAAAVVEADGRLVAAPLTLRASGDVHRRLLAGGDRVAEQLRAIALDTGGENLWIERVRFLCAERALPGGRDGDEDAVARFVRSVRAVETDEAAMAAVAAELTDLVRKLPVEVREGEEGLRLDEPETLRRLLDEAESLVVGRIGGADR